MTARSLPQRLPALRRLADTTAAPIALGVAAFLLAAIAQRYLDRFPDTPGDAALVFALAAVAWVAALRLAPPAVDRAALPAVPAPAIDRRRRQALLLGLGLVAVTTILWPMLSGPLGGGLGLLSYPDEADARGSLTAPGSILWLGGLALYLWAVVDPRWSRPRLPDRLALTPRSVTLVAVLLVTIAAAWLRLVDLDAFPREMTSDHTEKLLDIGAILGGWRPVFLPGNAGREPLQFYWTALLVRLGAPYGFWTLKLGAALVGTATVALAYVAGRRVGGRAVGVASAVIMSLAPWHLQIVRQSLRIGFAPLFVAAALALLLRALERGRRNDFLAVGAVAGLGLYGYTAFRPFLVVIAFAVALRLAHDAWRARRDGPPRLPAATLGHLAAAAGLLVILALPLARYSLDRPDAFWYRTRTRVSSVEQPLERPAAAQLVINMERALLMVNRTSDSAWFSSPPGRPGLETVGGALFVLGLIAAGSRAIAGDWRSQLLLVGLPLMLLSSAMALAFPVENPSLGRAAGALPVVVMLAALPVGDLVRWSRRAPGRWPATALVLLLSAAMAVMAAGVRQRVFTEYRLGYDNASLPTREVARAVRGFLALGGRSSRTYMVSWPHAWDYRAVAIEIGDPTWGNVLYGRAPDASDAVDEVRGHASDPERKMYLVGGPPDVSQRNLDVIAEVFPGSVVTRHAGHLPGKEFYTVFVPGEQVEGSR